MWLVKNYQTFLRNQKIFLFSVHFLRVRKTGEIWSSRKDVHKGLGVKNMSDIILKEIYGIYETNNLTNKQIQK